MDLTSYDSLTLRQEGVTVSTCKDTHSQDRPNATRRNLLTGGAVGLAAIAGSALGRPTPASAATDPSITDWVNVVSAYGADPTGVHDASGPINLAITTGLPDSGGVIYIPTGTYKISAATISAIMGASSTGPVYIRGAGKDLTILKYYGTGDCIRMYNSVQPGPGWTVPAVYAAGGGISDMTIDGWNAGSGSNGIHIGDSNGYELRSLRIQNFFASSSCGIYFDDTVSSMEKARVDVDLWDNHTAAIFTQNTDNTSGGTGTGSFMYNDFTFYCHVAADTNGGTTNGIIVRNGAYIQNASLRIRGNWQEAGAGVGACLKVIGSSGSSAQWSTIARCVLDIAVETDESGTAIPQTIILASPNNAIANCTGQLIFTDGWTPSTFSSSGQLSFGGVIMGDINLIAQNGPPAGWL
jgi:hypothetical protein